MLHLDSEVFLASVIGCPVSVSVSVSSPTRYLVLDGDHMQMRACPPSGRSRAALFTFDGGRCDILLTVVDGVDSWSVFMWRYGS